MNLNDRLFVQYGAGFSDAEGWKSFDCSPTLRIEKIPLLGKPLSKYVIGNECYFPESIQYGDIVKGLPIKNNSVDCCYASHVLEHLCLNDFRIALKNTAKMMKKNGLFRVIVPDLFSRAKYYIESVEASNDDASIVFLRSTLMGYESRPKSIMEFLRSHLGASHHLWMWDEKSLSSELLSAGFSKVRVCQFGDSSEPMFEKVERKNRFYNEDPYFKECCIEAEIA